MIGWNEEIKKSLKYCGENVFIGHNTYFIRPNEVVLHNNVRIDPFCYIASSLEVGSNTQITTHCVLGGRKKITLGNWTFIGYGSKLFTGSEDYSGEHGPVNDFWGSNKVFEGDITFSDFSGVAADTIVMPGVALPIGCTIGAKSFVYSDKNLAEWSVFVGNPLKFHKSRNREKVLELSEEKKFKKW